MPWAKTFQLSATQRTYGVIALVSIVLFAVATIGAVGSDLADWEKSLLSIIYNWSDNLRPVFLAITQLGSGWMLIIVPLVALANHHKGLATRLFINGVLAFALIQVAKFIVDRPRPVYLLSDVTQREAFVNGLGFPSGHTAIASVMAITLWTYIPKNQRWFLLVWILLVGLSRIYLGVHAPLDVVGGLAIGTFVASMAYILYPKRGRTGKI